ncbi:MAG: 50S ribosomal protein L27 [Patescibacteria group bacterium]
MAHVKAGGTTSLGRDSISKRLGVKIAGGQYAKSGSVIVRQRGTRFSPGSNVKKGEDDTLYATKDGYVKFARKKLKKFTGNLKWSTVVSITVKN